MKHTIMTHNELYNRASEISHIINRNPKSTVYLYPIARGGIPVAYLLLKFGSYQITDKPELADYFIDDIIDSGKTMYDWCDRYPGIPFLALVNKLDDPRDKDLGWVVFPWEGEPAGGIEDNIVRILEFIGEEPDRGGLQETPARVAKALQFWFKGYSQNPEDVLKTFEDGADKCDEMVVVKDIPFYSKCEHHMADIFGTATIAYIPSGKIVGLSKLSRLLDIYARRLQVQERLTNQVADALMKHLEPLGAGVVIKARHMCMESRGVCQQGHYTITSALRGVMKDQAATRAEFLALVD